MELMTDISLRRIRGWQQFFLFRVGCCVCCSWIAALSRALLADYGENFARHLRLTLTVPHAGVKSVAGQQLAVGAALNDHALIEHEDLIGTNDSREPVRDDQRRAVSRYAVERVLNVAFGVGVERGGRL